MNKYLSFFRLRFLYGLQYRAAALGGMVTQFGWGILKLFMFYTFYTVNPDTFPMSFPALSTYIWMEQAFLTLYMIWYLENDIFESIKTGNIAYELCRPIDIYKMWFTKSLAVRISRAVLRSIPILLFVTFLPYPYKLSLPANAQFFFWFLITMVLALLVVVAFSMLIYIITFYTLSPMGVRIVTSAIAEFMSGAVIPLPFLPEKVQSVLEILPFASMQNVPLRVYTGDISGLRLYKAIILQVLWIFMLLILGKVLMRKALKKVVVQGG